MVKTSLYCTIAVVLALLTSVAHAQPASGEHPAYLHALSNLRAARAFLQKPAGYEVKWDENKAIREIDGAIREIKTAAIDDGKPLEDHPPVDIPDYGGRLHKAAELLERSRNEIDQHEDNVWARGLKKRALGHLDAARGYIQEAFDIVEAPAAPAKHPAYLHALSDLRAARAWLQKPSGYSVRWDENKAIHEVEEAIREIKAAAIDDGKPLDDHPPIDIPDYGGRLHKAAEALARSRADIDQHEDNTWARGLKARALHHLDAATGYIQEAFDIVEAPAHHPAYMHALSDLRLARALLQRPTRSGAVKWDENTAIREIDGAIHEIKDAALDDGKPLEDHPPIDAGEVWGGRLQKAMDLVSAARADIDKREDDRFARGMKRRAIRRLDAAILAIRLGQDDARAAR